MRESGPWFSPHPRSETLSSDDPPVRTVDPPAPRIDRPPGRARLAAALAALHALLTRPGSGWQLVGVWSLGFAAVAGVGMGVAAVLGAPPPVLADRIERLVVVPGGDPPEPAPSPPATSGRAVPADNSGPGSVGRGGMPAPTRWPVPGSTRPADGYPGPVTGTGVPTAPQPGTGVPTTPQESVAPTPVEQPSTDPQPEPETPPADPTDPPTSDPTADPVPSPEDPPPVEEPTQEPTAQPPAAQDEPPVPAIQDSTAAGGLLSR
jgi:hypothetical protein